MIPLIALGAAVVGASYGAYKYFSPKEDPKPSNLPKNLGDFATWGQPDTGKTTFITRLRGLEPTIKKESTYSAKRISKFEITGQDGQKYEVQEIFDLPGLEDRLNDWLTQVESRKNIFYIINLTNLENESYLRNVKKDIQATVEKIKSTTNKNKRVNIIGTHLDQSKWKGHDPARVNNEILQDDCMREIREYFGDVAGYVYSANLTDKNSSNRLIQDIINDCAHK